MSATIKDIARAAGVSRGTVDRVINGRGGVKPEVEQRIKQLIVEMDYKPNRAGKVLAGLKKPMKIGCMLPAIDNPFYSDVICGFKQAERELHDFGVSLEFAQVKGFDPAEHIRAIKELAEKNVSALCVSTVDVPEVQETLNNFIEKGIPVVSVNSDVSNTNRLCYVGCNYTESGRAAAGLLALIQNEPLEALIITGSLKMQGHNQRIDGFIQALKDRNIRFHVADVVESMDDDGTAYTRTRDALEKHKQVNCVYITAAGVAGACCAVKELGQENKPTVLTFDDVPATRELVLENVIAATICQEPFKQGYESVKILYDYFVNGTKPKKAHYFTDTVIKIRENIEPHPPRRGNFQ
ncbi:substrate-binding domain-containing protein [Caproiciproducens galactitolivorans]|uniref:HTH-type transcriptional regulator DegA n=1 Tax=Caproiciproducens galactitolivorans TaxID=642589 RepID=A0A4Z0YCJ6_9FIRM|nr:LacI family DNA-binding transcriptional regulator [Caproiciproducens galactitolivorans]QEY35275.1 substrate-binding domain-containing protein [Caproiciproducens galactitolivorans]TGJ76971.1 HTH-type transcriptional regulator DegA [Caproiciproducens galactitolivorans]